MGHKLYVLWHGLGQVTSYGSRVAGFLRQTRSSSYKSRAFTKIAGI